MTVLSLFLVSTSCLAVEVDLTRHLATLVRTAGLPDSYTERFFGTVDGDARIIVTNGDGKDVATRVTAAAVFLNGRMVVSPERFGRLSGTIEVPVSLLADNEITVQLRGKPGAVLTVRVKQVEDVNLNIVGRIHFQVNASDFATSKAFYRLRGLTTSLGPAYIDTPEVAALLGVSQPVEVEGELIQLPSDGSVIELVQWKSPSDPEPAYPPPINHLGINRMAYFTLDLEGDVARLKAQGVEFLSEIAPCCSGPTSTTGIVAFRDPDGTFIELLGAITPP